MNFKAKFGAGSKDFRSFFSSTQKSFGIELSKNTMEAFATFDIEAVIAQEKTIVPSAYDQVTIPDDSFNALAKVTVKAVPYAECGNNAGGYTVTIL